jgi:hypothetical protein
LKTLGVEPAPFYFSVSVSFFKPFFIFSKPAKFDSTCVDNDCFIVMTQIFYCIYNDFILYFQAAVLPVVKRWAASLGPLQQDMRLITSWQGYVQLGNYIMPHNFRGFVCFGRLALANNFREKSRKSQ